MRGAVVLALTEYAEREAKCWGMAEVFLAQRDAHGLQDIGVELQAIQHSKRELERLLTE